jgi:hypothetical protein
LNGHRFKGWLLSVPFSPPQSLIFVLNEQFAAPVSIKVNRRNPVDFAWEFPLNGFQRERLGFDGSVSETDDETGNHAENE